MSNVQAIERTGLRLERARLDHRRTRDRGCAARAQQDVDAVRAFGVRLAQHRRELTTFVTSLEAFHSQYRPLGE